MSIASPAVLVKDVLVAGGLGTFNATSGWSLTIGMMPDNKDQCIMLSDTFGTEHPYLDRAITPMRRENVQVQVRCMGYAAMYAKAMDIIDYLRTNVPSGCLGIHMRNGPIWLGFDDKQRAIVSINFTVTRNA